MGQRDQLLDAIDAIYDAALGNIPWRDPLGQTAAILGGRFCALEFIDKSTGEMRAFESDSAPEITQDYLDEYFKVNPRFGDRRRQARVIVDYDFLDEEDMNRDRFYAEFLGSHGMRYCAGVFLKDTRRDLVSFSVQRTQAQGHAQSAEIRHIEVLTPHLRRAILLSERLDRAGNEASDYAAGLDRLSDGIAFLDDRGRILHLNRFASELLARNDGLFVSGGALRAAVSGEHARLSLMIAIPTGTRPLAHGHAVELAITRPSGLPAYIVSAIPIRPHDVRSDVFRGSRTVLMIRDPMAFPPAKRETLREAFGLTDAEASLALALAAGETPTSYARTARIKIPTVRTQLSALIRKMEVERQADIVRVVTRMSALFHP